ncbi:hypothetical protein V5O48_001989 [Marasmius crinis-equi]|uniref:Phospholipid/glycerol acyltransferase domain-containing protein n=1 Tax=Marasmius crinis-equi TaxID=585013 RepID=A0ABR3FWT2_9AGAR
MVELKIVYRILRKISDWTLAGYYDEVEVYGHENVPQEGPLILVSTHHNEIIDIATLAATIPHRRHISFWAKSSMFKSLIGGSIMSSSGAIPVKRNPNRASDPTDTKTQSSQSDLFISTSRALSRGQVVGVFPEGTSYTQPSIVQIMSGPAWAAVEYLKWERGGASANGRNQGSDFPSRVGRLVIVPVAIVYTDKSQYLSRVVVRYGTPIRASERTKGLFEAGHDSEVDEQARIAVKNIMAEVEGQLMAMTINADDWDTLFAVQIARDILWKDPNNIPLRHWTKISQTLVQLFQESTSSPKAQNAKLRLNRYFSLMHHTSLNNSLVQALFPRPFTLDSSSTGYPSRTYHIKTLIDRFFNVYSLLSLPFNLAAFVLFLPALITHIPTYISSHLLVRFLATPGEEEGIAQYAAIGGGIGFGVGWIAGSGAWAQRFISLLLATAERLAFVRSFKSWTGKSLLQILVMNIDKVARVFASGYAWSGYWPGSRVLGSVAFGWAMVKWHGLFVSAFCRKYKLLRATCRLHYILALIKPSTWAAPTGVDMEQYYKLPPPPTNEFIRKREKNAGKQVDVTVPPPISTHRLLANLLDSREKAKIALYEYMASLLQSEKDADRTAVEWLRTMGADTGHL